MTNKKRLKQTINAVCGAIFSECVAASLYSDKSDKADAEALLSSIITINTDYVKRVSHIEPGMKPKEYYKALKRDFSKSISEIVDQVSNL